MININEEELQCKICYEFLYETVLCDKCSNAFCQECAINYKKKAKKYGRVDKCPICGAKNFTFQRCEEIDKLIKKRKQKPLQCQHCKRIIFDKEKYEEHIKDCKYQCKFCLKVFDKEDDLLRHIKKNTEELFKALDLMNSNGNKIINYNEEKIEKIEKVEKPKKKKMVKNKTKDLGKNIEIKSERIEKTERAEKSEKKEKIDKLDKLDNNEDEKVENYPELSKKIVKKKIIKKKKKVAKKKDGLNPNTINYFDSTINDEDLMKNKINKINIDNKLITEIKKVNVSTELKLNEKNLKEMKIDNKFLKSSESIKDNIKLSNNNINNDVESNLDKSKEESKIENDNNKKENEEEWSKINSNKKEQELIFSNSGKKDFNNQVIEEEEKINRYVDYLNNPPPESIKPSTIPGDAKLNTEYDLFFCGKPNHIDCICCTEHKCKPGACMCISCMKLNKKYHKLKSHYLINKSGRACKYSHGFFHCYCNYTHIVHDVGNNIFKPVYRCQGENICKPCEEITLLMETYLPSTICQKLRDRETRQAQF
jgi:hypothetical protein